MDDQIGKLAKGDQQAFKFIFERYSPIVYRLSNRYLRHEGMAEDLVQEIFSKVWEKRETFKKVDNFEAYLVTMSKNLALKYLRNISKEEVARNEWSVFFQQEKVIEDQDEDDTYLQNKIREAVSLLPEQRQKVFQLAKYEGLTYNEISDYLNISSNTVRNHIVSANKFIRDHLRKESVTLYLSIFILLFSI